MSRNEKEKEMIQSPYVSYTDTVLVNGTSLFYVAEGRGKPVILLHGNGGSHNDLETTTRQLAQAGYLVYALDSRGQGANPPLPEYHYGDMAQDVFQFIVKKNLDHPAVFGWSDGGIVAILLELLHPGCTSLIATSGANIDPHGISDEMFWEIFGDGQNLPPLTRMMMLEPNLSDSDMHRIQVPALICAGENDLILEGHTRYIADNIPNSELCIVPCADHGSHIWHNRRMGDILLDYFRRQGY